MKKLTVILIFFCCFYSLFAQKNTTEDSLITTLPEKKIILYKIWIIYDWPKTLKGTLYDINDSSIIISNSYNKLDYVTGNLNLSEINYKNIDLLKIQREHSVRRAIFLGTLSGFIVGAIIGSGIEDNIEDDNDFKIINTSKGQNTIITGILCGFAGAGLGSVFGNIKIKIPIKGSEENFRNNKTRLKKYTIRK